MNDLKIYTVKEVAKILKVTDRTVREYITKKKPNPLKATKIGTKYVITEENLKEFISSN